MHNPYWGQFTAKYERPKRSKNSSKWAFFETYFAYICGLNICANGCVKYTRKYFPCHVGVLVVKCKKQVSGLEDDAFLVE